MSTQLRDLGAKGTDGTTRTSRTSRPVGSASTAAARLGRMALLLAAGALWVSAAACTGDAGGAAGNPPGGEPSSGQNPPAAQRLPPPISGGTLLVLRDGRTAVASDPDRDRIFIADLVDHQVRAEIPLPAGSEPGRAVEDAGGRVHAVLAGGGALLTFDPGNGRVLARRELCPAPRGLAFDAARDLLHVACSGGELVSIAPLAPTAARTRRLDRDLRDVLVQGERLLVSTFRKADLLVIGQHGDGDGTDQVARLRPERAPASFHTSVRGGVVIPTVPRGMVPGQGLAAPAVAWRLAPAPGGAVLMLHQRAVESEVGTTPAAYGGGSTCTGIVEATVSAFELGGATPTLRTGPALQEAVLAVDLAVSPDGRRLAVVNAGRAGDPGRNLVFYALETATSPAMDGRPCIPPEPTPDPVVEYRPPNGEVTAVAFDGRGNVVVQSRQPATLQILTERGDPIILSTEVRADPGHRLFHQATAGLLACASCHPSGGEDGLTWKFVQMGPRRTQSLRGGILDTAPFHWSGDMSSLEHLMNDVFRGRMSGPALQRPEIEALGRWLDAIPTVAPSRWHGEEAIARGKALFDGAAGCRACHQGPDFSGPGSFDVGTGGAFQVPQLHNLALRAPFLHDGCAATLRDRFTGCGGNAGDRHGLTSRLAPPQIDDLIAYLESL